MPKPVAIPPPGFDQLSVEEQIRKARELGFDGLVGDKFLVNGMIQPFLNVQPRRYRFRMLDTGPSRFYEFFLTNLQRAAPMTNDQ